MSQQPTEWNAERVETIHWLSSQPFSQENPVPVAPLFRQDRMTPIRQYFTGPSTFNMQFFSQPGLYDVSVRYNYEGVGPTGGTGGRAGAVPPPQQGHQCQWQANPQNKGQATDPGSPSSSPSTPNMK